MQWHVNKIFSFPENYYAFLLKEFMRVQGSSQNLLNQYSPVPRAAGKDATRQR